MAVDLVPVIAGAVTAAAVFGLVMTLRSGGSRSAGDLEQRLQGFVGAGSDGPRGTYAGPSDSGLMQDVVTLTGRMADRMGMLERVEHELEQADLPLRPAEALFAYMTAVVLAFVVTVALFGPFAAVGVGAMVAVGPALYLRIRRTRRLRRFETQLPDVLNLLSGSMRAGFSFAQGLEAVADEASEPAKRELQRVCAESRLGRPIEDALEDAATRMHSVDLMWAVMAIRIQREVGGNLAELLDTVATTMTERERLRHEVLALTAEGRMSTWVLGLFPPAFAVILYVIQPDYMTTLFHNALGVLAVIVSAIMAGFGFLWLRKIMAIEV